MNKEHKLGLPIEYQPQLENIGKHWKNTRMPVVLISPWHLNEPYLNGKASVK